MWYCLAGLIERTLRQKGYNPVKQQYASVREFTGKDSGKLSLKGNTIGSGEVAPCLEALATFAAFVSSVCSTYMVAHNCP